MDIYWNIWCLVVLKILVRRPVRQICVGRSGKQTKIPDEFFLCVCVLPVYMESYFGVKTG